MKGKLFLMPVHPNWRETMNLHDHKSFHAYQLLGVRLFHRYIPQGIRVFQHYSVSNTKCKPQNNKDVQIERKHKLFLYYLQESTPSRHIRPSKKNLQKLKQGITIGLKWELENPHSYTTAALKILHEQEGWRIKGSSTLFKSLTRP